MTDEKLPQINVKVPKQMDLLIERLVEKGKYASKSELVRDGIRKLLKRDKRLFEMLPEGDTKFISINIKIPKELDKDLSNFLKLGWYASTSEVVREGIRLILSENLHIIAEEER